MLTAAANIMQLSMKAADNFPLLWDSTFHTKSEFYYLVKFHDSVSLLHTTTSMNFCHYFSTFLIVLVLLMAFV